jgi:hypothetical protein
LPQIAEIVFVQEAFIGAEVQVLQLHFRCIVSAGKPAQARYSVVLLANAEAMEVEIGAKPLIAGLLPDLSGSANAYIR